MILQIEIHDSKMSHEQAKALRTMTEAILIVKYKDGSGLAVHLDPLPRRITPTDLLMLKARIEKP